MTTDQAKKNRARFAGQREQVFKRDNYRCVDCGMTMVQHRTKYKKDLTINHIDGHGRNSPEPNNAMSNLETLCLPCHGHKDCQNAKWHKKSRQLWVGNN